MLLDDVATLVYSIFSDDPESGYHMLRLCKPPRMLAKDFYTFLICKRMAKFAKDAATLYNMIDVDGDG